VRVRVHHTLTPFQRVKVLEGKGRVWPFCTLPVPLEEWMCFPLMQLKISNKSVEWMIKMLEMSYKKYIVTVTTKLYHRNDV